MLNGGGARVNLINPKRGDKKDIVDFAMNNAKQTLGRRLSTSATIGKILDQVGERFGLEKRPERIEVYDNSHIQGTNAVGAMIVLSLIHI